MARRTRISYVTPTAHEVEHKGKPLPIMLEVDGNQLVFRHEGHRKRYTLSIPDAFRHAIVATPVVD